MPISHHFSRYFYGVTRDVNRGKVRCKWAVFDFSPWCPSDRVQHPLGRRITDTKLIIIDDTRAPGWPVMNFCCTFRTMALKEIGKIYTVRGKKFYLSFPAPYTCVFFCSLLSCGLTRLPQRENLLAGCIHTSYMHKTAISPSETWALVI